MWNVKIEYKKFVIHKKRNNFFVSHKDEILFFWHVIIFLLLRDNKNISPWHYSKQCPKQKFGVARKTIFCRILCLFLFFCFIFFIAGFGFFFIIILEESVMKFCEFFIILTLLVGPCISESCIEIKIKLNFYFHTSLWYLHKTFWGTTNKCEKKNLT